MRLNEGLLIYTSLDEQEIILLEKMMEGFCFYLPLYREISFLIPEKNGEEAVVVCAVRYSPEGEPLIDEGGRIKYAEEPCLKHVLDSNKGLVVDVEGEEKKIIYLPMERNQKSPFAVVRIRYEEGAFCLEDFLANLKSISYMEKIYDRCFSEMVADPYIFVDTDGNIHNLNSAAEGLRERIGATDVASMKALWQEREGRISISDITLQKVCSGIDFEIKGFHFFVILFPLILEKEYRGMLACFYDISYVQNMMKEAINTTTIIKEVHHRVKSNLQTIASLLSLQTRRTYSPVAEKALEESINRISSIALVYEALSKDDSSVVNMCDCIKNIMSMILNNMVEPDKIVKGEIRGKDIYLNSTQASNVSLCINEMIQNSIKHGFALRKKGNILVNLDQVNQEVIITVEDDGVGLSGKKAKGNSLGLKIIHMITEESLKGSFKLESHTYGTVAEIRFHI